MKTLNFWKTFWAEKANRLARWLICREDISEEEYQFWLDQNPRFKPDGSVEHIRLRQKLNVEVGTNDLFRALMWYQKGNFRARPEEIVVKICKPYAPVGPDRHHRLNQINSAFYDEVRINNLIRSTNIEGVIRPLGGLRAGRLSILKMEYIRGNLLDHYMEESLSRKERLRRLAQVAYLANTISQLHYYQVIHMDLKPGNLILCEDPKHPNYNKILVFDFGYANSRLRESVSEFGGQFTPLYNAPEQALMTEHLGQAADYFSLGIVIHEYITGKPLFPKAFDLFVQGNYTITEEYMEHLRTGRDNQIQYFPRVAELIDLMTIFDSTERSVRCPNLFEIAHELKDLVKSEGFEDVNTEFLDAQLLEYEEKYQDRTSV